MLLERTKLDYIDIIEKSIYNIDSKEYDITKWSDLENVRFFYDFFKKREREFE